MTKAISRTPNDRDTLCELLVAAVTLALEIGEASAADHILEALRELHHENT